MTTNTAFHPTEASTHSDVLTPPPWLRGSRIPSLDGLRAISITVVTLSHVLPAPGSPWENWNRIRAWGGCGVDVFFVISGFLITHLLLREFDKSATISLRGFYVRRSFRIIPGYLFLLTIALAFSLAGFITLENHVWISALTYTFNLVPEPGGQPIEQIWSLCVEEHFYLLWPLTFLLLGRRRAPLGLLATIAAAPVFRFILWDRYHGWIDLDRFTPARIDTIAVGCLLAFVAHHPRSWRLARSMSGHGDWISLAAFAVFCMSFGVLSHSGKYALGPKAAIEATAVAIIVIALVNDPRCRIGRLLNTLPFVAVGVLSYSLYLGQTFASAGQWPGWPLGWAWSLPLIVCYALVSYWLIERPFLRLKDRLTVASRTAAGRRKTDEERRAEEASPELEQLACESATVDHRGKQVEQLR